MNEPGGTVTHLALCWRLERRDGSGLALTSHDRPLMVDGERYEPSPGIVPATLQSEIGIGPTSCEVSGSLSSAAISDADVTAGRWDGACVRLFAVDWSDPGGDRVELMTGELGQVASKDNGYEAELLGAAAQLHRPVCPVTSPECRAELGDPFCRIDMAGRRIRARVIEADGNLIVIDRPIDDRFLLGRLRVLTGAANGERSTILAVEGRQVTLRNATAATIEQGAAVELTEGCDKRLESCSERFGNAANFRGEPHLPGNDLLTRYPGS